MAQATPAEPRLVRLSEVNSDSHTRLPQAAVLLWRWRPADARRRDWSPRGIRRRLVNRLIAGGGRGPYCHASVLQRVPGDSRILEVAQFAGGRQLSLRRAVAEHPATIDVYRPNRSVAAALGRSWRPDLALAEAQNILHQRYGWRRVIWAGLRHTWAGRWAIPPAIGDLDGAGPYFCSDYVSRCLRAGGVDPVPNCGDSMTEPADLMRSLFLQYQFTLLP